MNNTGMGFPVELLSTLRTAQRIAILTGAGISAESGVPTFRKAQTGLWSKYNPQELATPQAFRRNPELVWEWYAWRRELVSQAKPNPGHFALAEMERLVPDFTLITQNVDGLHRLAGNQNIIELHGSLQRTKCFEEEVLISTWPETKEVPPRCPNCGGRLRPDVVWFGENIPQQALEDAMQAAFSSQVFLSIGTSGIVQPAASLPLVALQAGAIVVEINPEKTTLSESATYLLKGSAGQILPDLVQAIWQPQ